MILVSWIVNKFWGGECGEEGEEDVAVHEFLQKVQGDENVGSAPGRTAVSSEPPSTCTFSRGYRTGKVTALNERDGIIDGKYYFDRKNASVEGLDCGVVVDYTAFRRSEEQEWTVELITNVHSENWNEDASDGAGGETLSVGEADEVVVECPTNTRTIVGTVMCRDGREVTVRDVVTRLNGAMEPRDTSFSLDNVSSEFTPMEGDVVSLNAHVELSEESLDVSGKVLEVLSIKPQECRRIDGEVTYYHSRNKQGVINDDIWFNRDACEAGYLPKGKDQVQVDAILCKKTMQRKEFNWRALSVVPCHVYQEHDVQRKKPQKLIRVDPKLLENKGNIIVQENTDFGPLPADNDSFKIRICVSNHGEACKVIHKITFESDPPNLSLFSPSSAKIKIEPQNDCELAFNYKKEFLGYFSEVVTIHFGEFEIGREVKWSVFNHELSSETANWTTSKNWKAVQDERNSMVQKYLNVQEQKASVVPGVYRYKAPSFVKFRIPLYPVDDKIKAAMCSGVDGGLVSRKDAESTLKKCCPELSQGLTSLNHLKRFHQLLFVSEVDCQIDMSRHTKERVCFIRRGSASEYLALEIPGLAEGRPSLMVGDRIIACHSWDDKAAKLQGIVHEVRSNEVWLKFSPHFHNIYNGEDYDIYFDMNRSCFRKCHAAIDLASRNQASRWLFPKAVQAQPPQVWPEVIDDEDFYSPFMDKNPKALVNGHVDPKKVENEGSANSFFASFKSSPEKNEVPVNGVVVSVDDIEKSVLSVQKSSRANLIEKLKPKKQNNTSSVKIVSQENEVANLWSDRRVKLEWINRRLNLRQKKAVFNILLGEARPLPYIIFGPPGTGKTVTLVETILQIYKLMKNSRILIATPSNSSANLVAERLLESRLLQAGDMVRVVAHHVVAEGRLPQKLIPFSATINIGASACADNIDEKQNGIQSLNTTLIMSRRIIVGTCMAVGQMISLGLPKGHFSHIVVDEAGQSTEPEILLPLAFLAHETGQAILAGDPHQLGPVVQSSLARSFGLDKSLLSRLLPKFPYQRDATGFPESGGYDPRLVTRLTVNYRSLPDILELPSSLFYDSDLEPSICDTESYEAHLLARVTKRLAIPHSAVVFHGIRGCELQDGDSPSFFNPQEMFHVCEYVRQLLAAGVTCDEIGVITPYQKQVSQLRWFLEKVSLAGGETPQPIKIGSVEEFQGQEKMVIILSTVRSIGSGQVEFIGRRTAKQLLGFVNNKERLNVAISRARALLLVCGDPEVLCVDHYWRSVVIYCLEKGSYIGTGVPKILLGDS